MQLGGPKSQQVVFCSRTLKEGHIWDSRGKWIPSIGIKSICILAPWALIGIIHFGGNEHWCSRRYFNSLGSVIFVGFTNRYRDCLIKKANRSLTGERDLRSSLKILFKYLKESSCWKLGEQYISNVSTSFLRHPCISGLVERRQSSHVRVEEVVPRLYQYAHIKEINPAAKNIWSDISSLLRPSWGNPFSRFFSDCPQSWPRQCLFRLSLLYQALVAFKADHRQPRVPDSLRTFVESDIPWYWKELERRKMIAKKNCKSYVAVRREQTTVSLSGNLIFAQRVKFESETSEEHQHRPYATLPANPMISRVTLSIQFETSIAPCMCELIGLCPKVWGYFTNAVY